MGELNKKRLNFMTSEIVDAMFRKQAEDHGMGLSEYFKHMVLSVDKQKIDKARLENMLNFSADALKNLGKE